MSQRPENERTSSDTGSVYAADNTSPNSTAELTAVVDELLGQLSQKFNNVSSELLSKMDDMSRRLDNLEATIQAGEGNKGSGSGK